MLSQVAIGLDEAHARKFVHRDLKPDNVFLCQTHDGDIVKILDFGSVKDRAEGAKKLTVMGTTIGSPYYMAPEQAQGLDTLDQRADVWALAAIVYESVTGRVPFPGPNPAVVMTKHLNEPLEPPDEVNPRLTRGTGQIIEKMMAKDRDLRYQSPSELLVDLQAWLEGRIVVAPKIELKSRRRFRRFR